MTDKDKQPKPDDRSDNIEKLQAMEEDTIQNMEKSKETMKHLPGEEKEDIKKKNKRREAALDNIQNEIADESKNKYE